MSDQFEKTTAGMDYPVVVVTVAAGGERNGCLVGFFTQCSIDPVRLLVCLSNKNRTYRLAHAATALGVHLLSPQQRELAELFGGDTGDDVDKLARCAWHAGPSGVPVLDDCPRWLVGEVLERIPLGDHDGFLITPTAGGPGDGGPTLMFSDVNDVKPGHDA